MIPWTPEYIDSALWLDAADSATVTLVSGVVSQWADKSGNARHATQTSSTVRPGYLLSELNGKNVLSFDGSDDKLIGTVFPALNDFMVFAVVSGSSVPTTNQERGIFTIDNGDGSGFVAGYWLERSTWGGLPGKFNTYIANTELSGGDFPAPTEYGFCCHQRIHNTSSQVFTNGSPGTKVVTGNQVTAQVPSNTYNIGRTELYFVGNIAEILVTTLTADDERQKIEGYLAHKWGLSASLPDDHPYKINPFALLKVSGIITDRFGNPCQRKVYAVSRPTDSTAPVVIDHTLSDAVTGAYELIISVDGEVTFVAISEDDDPLLNDLIDRVIPG